MNTKEYWSINDRMSNQPTISEKSDKERKFQSLKNVVTQIMLSFLTGPASNKSMLLGYKRLYQQVLKALAIVQKAFATV